MTSTQLSKLLWEPSTGFLPDMISSRKTPKAKTSVFSSTMPCMKYSGAKHLRRHRQLPCRFRALMPILGSIQELRDEYPNVPSIGATACDWTVEKQQGYFIIYLRLKAGREEYVGGLDVSVDDPSLAPLVQVMESARSAHRDVVPQLPSHWRRVLICRRHEQRPQL
ncbi:hypothetical protein BHE74_00021784 [Ensete ventricosum]|nr:hypothetical protein GW17_00007741 [Ensete ventricosum]RWW70519.1 hypothetical protein BHE74_00021784 [Ensete ventricosum]RZR77056.1 hypothetical protein BHM03_00002032 [Ensete ventricosum]